MLQDDRHLTTEQLSAFLDQQLSEQEQARGQVHLDTCEDCRRELTGLRQTVTLLRALPPAELPRSFVLPVESVQDDEKKDENEQASTARRPVRLAAFRVAVQAMSSLAAVIGVFFLASTLLTMLPMSMQGHANSGSADTAVSASQGTKAPGTDPTQEIHQTQPGGGVSPNLTTNTAGTPVVIQTQPKPLPEQQKSGSVQLPKILFFDLNTEGGRAGAGILLLMFGIMGILLTRRGDKLNPARK